MCIGRKSYKARRDFMKLTINNTPFDAHPFINLFIEHTVSGMLDALKNTHKIKDLNLIVKGDDVRINLNGILVPLNAMTSKLIKSTVIGMVSTLPEVNDIKELSIIVHK